MYCYIIKLQILSTTKNNDQNDKYYFSHACFIVRLVNGLSNYEGRVEVYHNGVWGTVCDDGWDWNNAQVVCNELDLGYAVSAIPNAFYGQGSGQIWLDGVNCVGTEKTIVECTHRGWGSHNCNHSKDASVKCGFSGKISNFLKLNKAN